MAMRRDAVLACLRSSGARRIRILPIPYEGLFRHECLSNLIRSFLHVRPLLRCVRRRKPLDALELLVLRFALSEAPCNAI